jgi:ABC-type phosphate/phosphonate transport system substrate-binding protein
VTDAPQAPMLASLAMYPFEPLRGSFNSLWTAVRSHLGWGPAALEWGVMTPDVWQHPDLLLAQTCGWPLVTRLRDDFVVVGAFDFDVPGAADGRYRSVLVSRHHASLDGLRARPGVVAAMNAPDSLSGWISLQAAWGSEPEAVVETGGHIGSIRSLAAGTTDVASIDAVSWALISSIEPELVRGLFVVGSGPLVPCLPVVVPLRYASRVAELRAAFSAAVADPSASEACAELHIRGFVPFDLENYLPLLSLLPST